jgi:hypothetical protein
MDLVASPISCILESHTSLNIIFVEACHDQSCIGNACHGISRGITKKTPADSLDKNLQGKPKGEAYNL